MGGCSGKRLLLSFGACLNNKRGLFPWTLNLMKVWPNEMMFILQHFENYKCWWDWKPNITAVSADPEKLFSGSCQQIVINFFVVVQARFWACSPLARWASRAVTGTLCRTDQLSLLSHWQHCTVPIPLKSWAKLPLLCLYLQTGKHWFLGLPRGGVWDLQRWVSFVLVCIVAIGTAKWHILTLTSKKVPLGRSD